MMKMMIISSPATSVLERILTILMLVSAMGVAFSILSILTPYNYNRRLAFTSICGFNTTSSEDQPVHDEHYELRKSLKAAASRKKTVILTFLNEAWAAPNSIFDIFLDSIRTGDNTARLLKHLLVVALDDNAYVHCQASVAHCYLLKTNQSSQMSQQAEFMTPLYLDLVWGKVAFMQAILTLGYNFLLTDNDIVWFRDPFQHFTSDADFQVSCDRFNYTEYDLRNQPNVGFTFVKSNNRTIEFFKYWLSSRQLYPYEATQYSFNKIKFDPFTKEIGIKIRFLSTDYFGGFCEPSRDFNKVCTMHANCCIGLRDKIAGLKATLEDWMNYISPSNQTPSMPPRWRITDECQIM